MRKVVFDKVFEDMPLGISESLKNSIKELDKKRSWAHDIKQHVG